MSALKNIRDVDALRAYILSGGAPRYLCFWGHRANPDGRIGKTCLSQWFPAPFEVDGMRYQTAEHYMMAEKARLFGGEDVRQQILAAHDPGKVKALGRTIRGFNDQVWLEHRFAIVVRGNLGKFSQNASLRSFLLSTQERILVEASPVDSIWGIGLDAADEDAESPHAWKGLNLLGFALMEVRALLSGGQAELA